MPLRHRWLLWTLALLLPILAFACEGDGVTVVVGDLEVQIRITPEDPRPFEPMTIDASGSTGPIARVDITIRDGNGLTVSSLTGTARVQTIALSEGTYSVTVLIADARNNTASRTVNFVTSDCGPRAALITAELPSAVVGSSYDFGLLAVGGVDPITFRLREGFSLPTGMTLSADGQLSGTPATGTAGSYLLQLEIRDSCNVAPRVTQVALAFVIQNPGACAPLNFEPGSPPEGQVGVFYSFVLNTTGGQPPVSLDVAAGSTLPPGLTLSGTALTGLPTTASLYTFGIRAQDSCPDFPQVVIRNYSLRVNP